MSQLTTDKAAHTILVGTHDFDAVRIDGRKIAAIQMDYSSIGAGMTVKLLMSLDNDTYCEIDESSVTLSQDENSVIWNMFDVPDGTYLKVRITCPSNPAGTISQINYLF